MSLRAFTDYYRCPEYLSALVSPGLSGQPGFFQFEEAICFGRCACPTEPVLDGRNLFDTLACVSVDDGKVRLPFDLTEVIDNLRRECYVPTRRMFPAPSLQRAYYALRPLLPTQLRLELQRFAYSGWENLRFPRWPLDTTVENILESFWKLILMATGARKLPFIWFWPDGYSSAAMITHDVDTQKGFDFCPALMDIDDCFEIKSSFQLVPEKRYGLPKRAPQQILARGFEVNVHDLNHDGRLFLDLKTFLKRAKSINQYAAEFGSRGFRSGMMYRNLDWCDALDFAYDMSVPNVAHLEPQQGGCCTVMPYFAGRMLILPLTTTQDFALLHVLREYSIDLWKQQLSSVVKKRGLASFIVHPDYLRPPAAQSVYKNLLSSISNLRSEGILWVGLPGQIHDWWVQRSRMQLVKRTGRWQIVGAGSERACIAYATLRDEQLCYEVDGRQVQDNSRASRTMTIDSAGIR